MGIALFPGMIPFDNSLLDFDDQVHIILGLPETLSIGWVNMRAERLSIREIQNTTLDLDRKYIDPKVFVEVLQHVMNDYSTFHIVHRGIGSRSLYNYDLVIERVVSWSLHMLTKHKITTVINHDTPHEIVSYIFNRVAQKLNIKTYSVRYAPLPWKGMIQEDIFDGMPLDLPTIPDVEKADKEKDWESIEEYLDDRRKSYDKGIPEYERKRLEKYKGKIWSWSQEIKFLIARKEKYLITAYSMYLKYKMVKMYKSVETPVDLDNGKYIIFFLHYQPERTTLPEGSIFNQQIIALKVLRMILPDDVSIYVKEHPSTFRNSLSLKARTKEFYRGIKEIKNTFIIPLSMDAFTLIDQSLFVGTITGTSIFESVVRGKPSVYFGNTKYKGIPGAMHIDEVLSNSDLKSKLLNGDCVPDSEAVMDYFRYVQKISIGEIEDGKGAFYRPALLRGKVKVLHSLMTKIKQD